MDPYLQHLLTYLNNYFVGENWDTTQADPKRKLLKWTILFGEGGANIWIEVKRRNQDIFVHVATNNQQHIPILQDLLQHLPNEINNHLLGVPDTEEQWFRAGYSIFNYDESDNCFAKISHMINLFAVKYFKINHRI
jgi:hypothetical protein